MPGLSTCRCQARLQGKASRSRPAGPHEQLGTTLWITERSTRFVWIVPPPSPQHRQLPPNNPQPAQEGGPRDAAHLTVPGCAGAQRRVSLTPLLPAAPPTRDARATNSIRTRPLPPPTPVAHVSCVTAWLSVWLHTVFNEAELSAQPFGDTPPLACPTCVKTGGRHLKPRGSPGTKGKMRGASISSPTPGTDAQP